MAESPDETDSMGDPTDDGQLTIRIPNPKMYMARQSLWIGRRGKPRCDHCRMNNLKCDRVLPACNHCSWTAGRECKYTPLPTPAHRGIPRCDRCREKNLKCDRNLPVCNHCGEEEQPECNYTPKKRYRAQADSHPASDTDESAFQAKPSLRVLEVPKTNKSAKDSTGHTFYGQNVASSSSHHRRRSVTPESVNHEGRADTEYLHTIPTGRFTADFSNSGRAQTSPLAPIAPRPSSASNPVSFKVNPLLFPSRPNTSSQGVILNTAHVEPWTHPSFTPLPLAVVQTLKLVNSVEIPNRGAFEDAFTTFVDGLMDDYRETAYFTPDVYASISRGIVQGEMKDLSPRLRAWASFHHLHSGSRKSTLLIMPRDSIFELDHDSQKALLDEYCAHVDGVAGPRGRALSTSTTDKSRDHQDNKQSDPIASFERLVVLPQIYDVLSYAHRSHQNSKEMFMEVRRLNIAFITWPMAELYIRLCPLCNLRGKQTADHLRNEPPPDPSSYPSSQSGIGMTP